MSESPINWLEEAIEDEYIYYFNHTDFNDFVKIDQGGFGEVYKAWWEDCNLIVALKSLKSNCNLKLIQEIKILKKNNIHPNIIHLYGVTKDLSSGNYKMHTKNILVDDRGTMLISDFGHSIHINDSNSIEEIYAMPAFTDPQCLMGLENRLTKTSDIYSLGVIFWEISSGKEPFENRKALEIIPLICQGKREEPIENMPKTYIDLYECCWDQNQKNRPEAKIIMNELDIIEQQLLIIWVIYLYVVMGEIMEQCHQQDYVTCMTYKTKAKS
ncbi:kinase-like protein [Gigaspora margarita]|uniref:Kinase-like protein n=1 Tax=Gigaspora margarita TaxID=4874 RepID=A0A8H4EWB6_GIGMA|nr:kinase-like protein [Gigaspora margarita]